MIGISHTSHMTGGHVTETGRMMTGDHVTGTGHVMTGGRVIVMTGGHVITGRRGETRGLGGGVYTITADITHQQLGVEQQATGPHVIGGIPTRGRGQGTLIIDIVVRINTL